MRRTQPRFIPIEKNPGKFYYYRFLQCNNTDNIEPIREIVTDVKVDQISRAQLFADNGLNKRYQYLDCLLWYHAKPNEIIHAQRNCGVKFLCSVDIENQRDCKYFLNEAIAKIKTKKDITLNYLKDSPSYSSHSNHPVQKVCTSLFPLE
ncbi:MAG: hypothetical protein OXC44_02295 [Proteobacteria bacterium]|nr:hypothetical protein [Pseudomonadota bacterium]